MALRITTTREGETAVEAARAVRGSHWCAVGFGGFTLAESLVASVVLAVAVVGIGSVLAASYQQKMAAERTIVAVALAKQLMEEIASRPFADGNGGYSLGPEGHETHRGLYDSANDYHGYEDQTDGLTTLSGEAVGLEGEVFRRWVQAEYRQSVEGPAMATGDFLLIRVGVESERGGGVVISQVLTRHRME